jgi:membrane fusion protein, multidrug efflux system
MNKRRQGAILYFLLLAISYWSVHVYVYADDAVDDVDAQSDTFSNTSGLDKEQIRAQLLPVNYTTLSAEIPARVNRIKLVEGDKFGAGDLIIELDCSLQNAQLLKARAELLSTERILDANQKLAAMNSVGHLELALAETAVDKAKAEVLTVETLLSKCRILAPFSGRIAEQKIREQQYVQAGQPLVDILDDSAFEIEFIVPSKWLTWLIIGQSMQIDIDETQRSYPATFSKIGARIDPVSQTIKVTGKIEGNFTELMAGMSGTVSIIGMKDQNKGLGTNNR